MALLQTLKRSGADIAAIKYCAFLSYSRRDVRWARWLQARLQRFRIDKDLVGRKTLRGAVPRALRPIFRDREDYSGSDALTDATIAALDRSAALIVLCSPSVFGRSPVNREVRAFRSRHPERPVIPVIVGGTSPDNIPAALRFELSADGMPMGDRPVTVLAPDLRRGAAGRDLGLARTVAGLTGLDAKEVYGRIAQRRQRRGRIWWGIAAAVLLVIVGAAGSAVYAWHELEVNEAFLAATLRTGPGLFDKAVTRARQYKVPRGATLEAVAAAEILFDEMAQLRPTAERQFLRARMLIDFARRYEALGDTARQLACGSRAYRVLAGLATAPSENAVRERDMTTAYQAIGDMLAAQGHLSEAMASYRDAQDILERLAAADPGLQRDLQRDLAVSHEKIGDVLAEQGDLPEALASYRDGLDIFRRLAAVDLGDAPSQRDLAASYEKIGDALADQGELPEALKSYQDGQDIFERLAAADAGDVGRQRDVAASVIKIGDVLAAQDQLPDAMASYRDGQDIFERLAATDPGWQRDLAASYEKIGDVLVKRARLPRALNAYREARNIFARLSAADLDDARRQHDLSLSYAEIGDVLRAQGDLPQALNSYRDAHALMERIAAADSANLRWQRDLALSHGKLAVALRAAGENAKALDSLRQGRAIIKRLTSLAPDNRIWQRDLTWFDPQIAELTR
jgi:tetratricopeptide (TPR) repeat protein